MPDPILVAYATRYGSTREVAEEVGKRLRDRGRQVEVKPARDVRSLEGYSAVVLGAPLYIGSLLGEAVSFLENHREALERKQRGDLVLGPLSADEDPGRGARSQLGRALAGMPWVRPVATELFVGAYDPSHLRLTDKLIAALPASPLHDVPAHDERDWAAIDAWADRLTMSLQ